MYLSNTYMAATVGSTHYHPMLCATVGSTHCHPMPLSAAPAMLLMQAACPGKGSRHH